MVRLFTALVVTACVAATAAADTDPDRFASDGKEALQAIHDRGIVLRAGKRHYIVVVPRVNPVPHAPKGTKFYGARIYFGDAKTLYFQGSPDTMLDPTESAILHGSPFDYSRLVLRGSDFVLQCYKAGATERREIALGAVSEASAKLFPSPALRQFNFPYKPYLLAREEHGTTYYYVDRPATVDNSSLEFRLFIGKRGAMKRAKLKELASDHEADILVTATGTLTIRKVRTNDTLPLGAAPVHANAESVLFGTDKKRTGLEILSIRHNHELIYRDLGLFTRDTDGVPCEVL